MMNEARRFHLVTHGCQMNVSDSEMMGGLLLRGGWKATDRIDDAELVILNTCAIREKPETKVLLALQDWRARKIRDPHFKIAVCGCVAQKEQTALFAAAPHLDMIFGPSSLHELPELVARVDHGERHVTGNFEASAADLPEADVSRFSTVRAFVTIQRGCDNFCTFCVVPTTRGREFGRPFRHVIEEIRSLAFQGYKDITVLGQNVNSYRDEETGARFPDLLRAIDEIPGHFRVRFMTSHPKDLGDDLIDVLARGEKLAPHVHLPVQSGSNRILRRMGRRYTVEHYLAIVERIRQNVKGVSLTTDLIVGFNGETEAEFEETLALMTQVRYDMAFMFYYSEREGTPALNLKDPVPISVRKERLARLIEAQHKITVEENRKKVGSVMTVLVESRSARSDEEYQARAFDNSVVNFPATGTPSDLIGSFVPVRIVPGSGPTGGGHTLRAERI